MKRRTNMPITHQIKKGVAKNINSNIKAEYQLAPNVLYRKSISTFHAKSENKNIESIDKRLGVKS